MLGYYPKSYYNIQNSKEKKKITHTCTRGTLPVRLLPEKPSQNSKEKIKDHVHMHTSDSTRD
jgi:hypothetical protein